VWFGDQDLMVPRTHGEWLVENLPSASKHFFAGEGHVSMVVNHLDELNAAIMKTYA
jgi:pimeloyl-ACP methyl ester carboxylesterase